MAPTPKHVLITGGSRGIGLSIAQLFAKNAYRCTLVSRSESNLQRALQTLTPLSPSPSPDHSTIAGDISSPAFWSAAQLGAALKSQSQSQSASTSQSRSTSSTSSTSSSKIDVLVNCAGITHSALFSATAPEDMQAVVDTNLTSLMLGTRFLLRSRFIGGGSAKKRGSVAAAADEASEAEADEDSSPVIINVASLLGLQGGYGAVAYAASKAGVLGFTRALAGEYVSHRVRVNAVVPGYVETDMTKGWSLSLYTFFFRESLFYQTMAMGWEGERERQADVFPDLNTAALQDKIPLKRFGRPEEIAQAALFLAQNQYAHNCVINVDGGLSAV
jgi:NAD(P)-dependent dehydrogenase (short-subunit alcohol dehydrogenase family)